MRVPSASVAVLGFLLVCGVLLVQVSPILNPPRWDEFIVVYDAHRVATGQVPYRDFFNFIPPGVFLLLALPFKVMGESGLTVGRYTSMAGMLVTFALLIVALRRRGWGRDAALMWASVVPLCLYPFWAVPSHHWLAAACAAGCFAALSGASSRGALAWLSAGLATGLAGLCVQTAGVGVGAACLVFLATLPSGRLKAWGSWIAGVSAIWLPLAIWLASESALASFLRDTVLWPMKNYSRGENENAGRLLQDLPWRLADLSQAFQRDPSPARLLTVVAGMMLYVALVVGTLAIAAVACAALVQILRRRTLGDPWIAAALLASAILVGLGARGNANWLHLVYTLAMLGPLWLCAWGGWSSRRAWLRRGEAVLLAVLLGSGFVYHTRGLWFHVPEAWELADADRPTREQVVNRFLREPGRLLPGDTIAAFPEGGEVYLYTAPAAVGYTYLLPLNRGYNSFEDHTAVADQIRFRRPKLVLLTAEMEPDYLDPSSPLASAISDAYSKKATLGDTVVYGLR